jgi:hypothetical protein
MAKATEMTRGELESLLRFYAESGIDFPLSDKAPNRFEAEPAAPAKPAKQAPAPIPAPAAPPRFPAIPDAEAIALAREIAGKAETLDDLRKAVEALRRQQPEADRPFHTIFEGGTRGAPIMMISGRAGARRRCLGRGADRPGRPAVRPHAGGDRPLARRLLSRLCRAVARAGQCRHPRPCKASICKPFVERQIELARPVFVVLLGNGAARIMLDTPKTSCSCVAKWKTVATESGFEVPAIATLQPRLPDRAAGAEALRLGRPAEDPGPPGAEPPRRLTAFSRHHPSPLFHAHAIIRVRPVRNKRISLPCFNLVLPIAGLLASTFLLLAGNGLAGVLLPIRASVEGWSPVVIGWIGFGYAFAFYGGLFHRSAAGAARRSCPRLQRAGGYSRHVGTRARADRPPGCLDYYPRLRRLRAGRHLYDRRELAERKDQQRGSRQGLFHLHGRYDDRPDGGTVPADCRRPGHNDAVHGRGIAVHRSRHSDRTCPMRLRRSR